MKLIFKFVFMIMLSFIISFVYYNRLKLEVKLLNPIEIKPLILNTVEKDWKKIIRLEAVVADLFGPTESDNKGSKRYENIGVRLDAIFEKGFQFDRGDWQVIVDRVVNSFPNKNLDKIKKILNCYYLYRMEFKTNFEQLINDLNTNSKDSYRVLFDFRVQYFGFPYAKEFFLIEHNFYSESNADEILILKSGAIEPICEIGH